MITPDRIRAFLDDLALISIKHGLAIDTEANFALIEDRAPRGYVYNARHARLDRCWSEPKAETEDEIASIDVEHVTAHQRIALERSLARVEV